MENMIFIKLEEYEEMKNKIFIQMQIDKEEFRKSYKLERRINKAIEYINSYLPNYDFDHSNLEKLLKIIKGEDNE